jgi:hypothetical protein
VWKSRNLSGCRVMACIGCGQQLRRFRASRDVGCLKLIHLRCVTTLITCRGCLGLRHPTWQLARNLLNCCTLPLHVITCCLDKFCDFRSSFGFSVIYKHFFRKLFVMWGQQVARNVMWVPAHDLNIQQISWISFFKSKQFITACTCSSNLKYVKKFNEMKKLKKNIKKIQN